jgi:hypothetical protein
MKIIVDSSLLIDDYTALQLLLYSPPITQSNSSNRRQHIPYDKLQFTNCFSQSPWQCGGKDLYRLLASYVNSSGFILYSKCPKEYTNWMTRERKVWCQREFGHVLHPLLICETKSLLKAFATTNCLLISGNANLCQYWKKYSNRCVLYGSHANSIASHTQPLSLEFVTKREEVIAHCRQLVTIEEGSIGEGSCDGSNDDGNDDDKSDIIDVDEGDNSNGNDIDIDNVGVGTIDDCHENRPPSPSAVTDAIILQNSLTRTNKPQDNDTSDEQAKHIHLVTSYNDDFSGDADGVFSTFCDHYAEGLAVIRNLTVLCLGYDYRDAATDGGQGLVGRARFMGSWISDRCGSCDFTADTNSVSDTTTFYGCDANPFCRLIDLHVISSCVRRNDSAMISAGSLECVVEAEYDFLSCLQAVTRSCEACFAAAVIEFLTRSVTACTHVRGTDPDRGGDRETHGDRAEGCLELPPLSIDHLPLVQVFIKSVRSALTTSSQVISVSAEGCPLCSPMMSAPMQAMFVAVIQHTLSVVVTNYSVHTTPSIALCNSQVPLPSAEVRVIERVFSSVKHVCCYQLAKTWRDSLYAATKACVKEHKYLVSHQWACFVDSASSESEGVDGGASKTDTPEKKKHSRAKVGAMMTYCSSENHARVLALVQDVVQVTAHFSERTESDAGGEGGGETPANSEEAGCGGVHTNSKHPSNPYSCRLTPRSLVFSPEDYRALSSTFRAASLWHLLPLWSVLSGLLAYVDYLFRCGKWQKHRFACSSEWREEVWRGLAVVEDLLWYQPLLAAAEAKGGGGSDSQIPGSNAVFEAIHKDMLSSLRYTCWQRRFSGYELLYGGASPTLQRLALQARDECGTSDNGFSPAKVHGILGVIKRHISRSGAGGGVGSPTKRRGGKRKRGRGLASGRLKHAARKDVDDEEDAERTPTKECEGDVLGPKKSVRSHISRDFRGHFMGRSRGRLLYRRLTATGSFCEEHQIHIRPSEVKRSDSRGCKEVSAVEVKRESMKVEHFAICRYLSILAQTMVPTRRDVAAGACAGPGADTSTTHPVRASSINSGACVPQAACPHGVSGALSGGGGGGGVVHSGIVNTRLVLQPLEYPVGAEGQSVTLGTAARAAYGGIENTKGHGLDGVSGGVIGGDGEGNDDGDDDSESGDGNDDDGGNKASTTAWKARGPGAWVHAVIGPSKSVPSHARGGGGGEEDKRGGGESGETEGVTWLGSHCEGSVWLTLFVLLLFEEMYDQEVPLGE